MPHCSAALHVMKLAVDECAIPAPADLQAGAGSSSDQARLSSSSSVAQLSPAVATSVSLAETVLSRASIRILGVSWQEDHYVYMIHVDTAAERFVVHRRFSEFRDLRRELMQMLANKTAPCANGLCRELQQLAQIKFPHRQLWKTRERHSLETAKERVTLLQRFVQAILRVYSQGSRRAVRRCLALQCPMLRTIMSFLRIPAPGTYVFKEGAVSPIHIDASGFRHARDLPPTTRVSLDSDQQWPQEQLFPISEDVQLLHVA